MSKTYVVSHIAACLYDLENHATAQDVDELHKYTLKPEQRSKLKALIGGQLPAAGERAAAPALVDCCTREEGHTLYPIILLL